MTIIPGQSIPNYQEIVCQLRQNLPDVLADRSIFLAYLHGSLARKQATSFSDVDIALVAEQKLPSLSRLNLELDIEIELAALGIPQADVRIINQAPLAVRGRIVTQGVWLYCRDEEKRIAFETKTRAEYFDWQPVLREQWRTYLNKHLNDLRVRGLI